MFDWFRQILEGKESGGDTAVKDQFGKRHPVASGKYSRKKKKVGRGVLEGNCDGDRYTVKGKS